MVITVVIADDHALVREGIKSILEKTTTGIIVQAEASNGKAVVEIARKTPADIYLLDISMPLMNGIEALDRLMKLDPKVRVIIVSMHDDRMSVERALKSGAKGYLIKESASEEVVAAVREVAEGRTFLSAKVARYGVCGFSGSRKQYEKKNTFEQLTSKEKEVLQLIAEGFSSKEIAKQIKIALTTVQVHRKNIMRKLGAHKQAELVRFALKEGIAHL